MMRRMKIKSTPKFFGGVKHLVPGNKLHLKEEPVEEYCINKPASEIKLCNSGIVNGSLELISSSAQILENITSHPAYVECDSAQKFKLKIEENCNSKYVNNLSVINSNGSAVLLPVLQQDASLVDSAVTAKGMPTISPGSTNNLNVLNSVANNANMSIPKFSDNSKNIEKTFPLNSSSISIQKLAARRTRMKITPVIKATKRPVAVTTLLVDNGICEPNQPKSCMLKKENNASNIKLPLTSQEGHTKSPKFNKMIFENSQLITTDQVESKENMNEKLKELVSTHKLKSNANDLPIMKEDIPIEKKVFIERKQKFRKKMSSGNLEKKHMTMFDLIFWNPLSNPMPGYHENERLHSRNNSADENCSADQEEEQNADEEGLQKNSNQEHSDRSSTVIDLVGSPCKAPCVIDLEESQSKTQSVIDMEESQSKTLSDEESIESLAPQVKIGPTGELIVDEKSVIIQTTAAKNRDEILSRTEVLEETNDASHFGNWNKKRKRSTEWTRKETARFYKALSTVGTDFSLMETIFAWRSRAELKIKFKKEERVNRHLIDTALNDCTQFDFSIFDESDYDPEEDRKKSKEAEKAEAKKKKELERERKRIQRQQDKELKNEQHRQSKLRKRKLKSAFNIRKKNKGRPRRDAPDVESCRSNLENVAFEPQEVICEVVFSVTDTKSTKSQLYKCLEEADTNSGPLNFLGVKSLKQNENMLICPSQVVEVDRKESLIFSSPPPPATQLVSQADKSVTSSSMFHVEDFQVESITLSSSDIATSQNGFDQQSTELPNNQILDLRLPAKIKADTENNFNTNDGAISKATTSGYSSQHKNLESDFHNSQLEGYTEKEDKTSYSRGITELVPEYVVQTPNIVASSHYSCPVTNVQVSPEGHHQFVEINTSRGIKKISVPSFESRTSSIVVIATPDSENIEEHIYDVYTVAPLNQDFEPELPDAQDRFDR